jgi:HEAT repeats
MPLVRKGAGAPPPTDASGAEERLRGGTDEERWVAARALSGDPQAAKTLGAALAVEPDRRVREAILTGLARIGTAESAETIVPLIRSEDAGLRTEALDALRLMPQALTAHLPGLLADPEADVRLLACDLARELPAAAATRILCDLLAREPEANVCAAAVEVLTECAGPEALPALSACAERFAETPFLVFSLRIAGDRIRAQSPAQDG